ncbi:hypothetical protein [Microvirga flavescens]|uniref:hypothetical protein n=1 Tax=Microvirga flavescens TaxID=2249811 RepID=UPI0018E0B784|nr:hypothetical protein [Microvirga flavescens]
MTDEEVEIVAEELAKIGGTSWYPGRESSSILRVISDRYRDRARAAIAALDRYRAQNGTPSDDPSSAAPQAKSPASPRADDSIAVGDTVVYRPPADRRAYSCTVDAVREGEAYLVLNRRENVGWVPLPELLRVAADHESAENDQASKA